MEENNNKKEISKTDLVGQKIQAVPKESPEIGADVDGTFVNKVLDGVQSSSINVSALEGLNQTAQSRENTFTNIDAMASDSTISAALEIYAEDTVEPNEKGDIIWCESSNADIASYVTFLLKSYKVNKHAFSYAYNLVRYGDIYVRLYRESDKEAARDAINTKTNEKAVLVESRNSIKEKLDKIHADEEEELKKKIEAMKESTMTEEDKKKLEEDLKVHAHAKKGDHYVTYAELIPNPSEMFDLQQFGKCMGFIKAPVMVMSRTNAQTITNFGYKYKSNDITIFDSTDIVHASLESSSDRVPETVELYAGANVDEEKNKFATYTVKRGQSILYNSFKIWRELTLLENSILLNRLTKSSIVRILNVECGTLSKEQANLFVQRLKDKIEQKMSINVGSAADEYTNPGPVENIIYIPTHGTQGTINSAQLGDGQVDPKQLTDLEYFRDKLFANLRIPKQYLAQTGDSTGFNGGTSLSIISSRYGKAIKRIQNTICQMVTDMINLILIDRGLDNYINKFTIRMQPPLTQEEKDKKEAAEKSVGYVSGVVGLLSEIQTPSAMLRIKKAMLAGIVNNPEVIDIIQQEISKLEEQEKGETEEVEDESVPTRGHEDEEESSESDVDKFAGFENDVFSKSEETSSEETSTEEPKEEPYLPTADELSQDMTDNTGNVEEQ